MFANRRERKCLFARTMPNTRDCPYTLQEDGDCHRIARVDPAANHLAVAGEKCAFALILSSQPKLAVADCIERSTCRNPILTILVCVSTASAATKSPTKMARVPGHHLCRTQYHPLTWVLYTFLTETVLFRCVSIGKVPECNRVWCQPSCGGSERCL